MTEGRSPSVVVGVDGSTSSLSAARWAAGEAVSRGASLVIVHAWLWPLMRVPLGPAPGVAEGGLAADANRVLRDASDAALGDFPELEVRTELVTGTPQAVLSRSSRTASLLVVGSRGLGGFTGMLLGSVAVSLTHHSACPVVVVRGEPADGPVVVGVDGSAGDVPALGAALERAVRCRARVLAIHAYDAPTGLVPAPGWSSRVAELEHAARRLLDGVVEAALLHHPGVAVERRVVASSPTAALVNASRHAQVVVVASHGAGALLGLVGGSVCHGVIYHAHCPVEVVPVPSVVAAARPDRSVPTTA